MDTDAAILLREGLLTPYQVRAIQERSEEIWEFTHIAIVAIDVHTTLEEFEEIDEWEFQ